jgi:hypothetical protein
MCTTTDTKQLLGFTAHLVVPVPRLLLQLCEEQEEEEDENDDEAGDYDAGDDDQEGSVAE